MKKEVIEMPEFQDKKEELLQNTIVILLLKLGGEAVISPEDQEKLKNYVGFAVEQVNEKKPHYFRLSLINVAEEENSENEHLNIGTRH